MSDPCTHTTWQVESTQLRHSTYGGVEEDFISFYVVCECGADGSFMRTVQELADEYTTIYWGPVGRLRIMVTDTRWATQAPADGGEVPGYL